MERALAIELELDFPSDDPVWCPAREVLITGGIRSGKSVRLAFRGLMAALNPSVRLIWLVGPTYPQSHEEFRYIMEWGLRLGVVDQDSITTPKDGSRSLRTITGCIIETRSGEHAERLASVAPDMILLCEPGQMSGEVYDACVGRLIQKRGHLIMGGTLDDNSLKPRWQWYEDLANAWHAHGEDSRERSFRLPTWANRTLYPLGEQDPELLNAREKLGDHKYMRMYGGSPVGNPYPVFPVLMEPNIDDDLLAIPDVDTDWLGGAIGVDYGRSWEHPSAAVVIRQDSAGNYWVSEAWKGVRADPTEIESVVNSFKDRYNIFQGCVDPNQGYMGDDLGFETATNGAGSTEMRISLTNGLLEARRLFFDVSGANVREVWASMRMCARVNRNGQLRYERPIGDDLAQCVNYAVEYLRGGGDTSVPRIDLGTTRVYFGPRTGGRDGRL